MQEQYANEGMKRIKEEGVCSWSFRTCRLNKTSCVFVSYALFSLKLSSARTAESAIPASLPLVYSLRTPQKKKPPCAFIGHVFVITSSAAACSINQAGTKNL